MNFKKIIALTAAISILMFSGCSSSEEAVESTDATAAYSESDTAAAAADIEADTEVSSENETSSETEETVTETSLETQADSPVGITAEEAYSSKNGESWTDALMQTTNSWDKGNIVFKCTAEADEEIVTTIEMSVYNNKVYMDTQIPGIMSMTMIIDGEKGYFIDKASKTYSYDTETSYDADNEVESVVDTTANYSSFEEDGIENIDGTDYIYEKFIVDDSEVIYYYSPDGKLQKFGADGEMADLTIDFLDEPDESCFEIPEDYTEISMEEMSMKMMAGLFSALEEATEEE